MAVSIASAPSNALSSVRAISSCLRSRILSRLRASMARRLAVVISQAPGLAGTPVLGHSDKAMTKRVLRQLLGTVDIAHQPGQARDEPGPLDAKGRLDRLVRLARGHPAFSARAAGETSRLQARGHIPRLSECLVSDGRLASSDAESSRSILGPAGNEGPHGIFPRPQRGSPAAHSGAFDVRDLVVDEEQVSRPEAGAGPRCSCRSLRRVSRSRGRRRSAGHRTCRGSRALPTDSEPAHDPAPWQDEPRSRPPGSMPARPAKHGSCGHRC